MQRLFGHAVAAIGLALISTGIAPAVAGQNFDRSRTYDASFDAIWTKLTKLLPSNDINIKTIDKQRGLIYAEATIINPMFGDNTKSRRQIKHNANCNHLTDESNYTDLSIRYNIAVLIIDQKTTVHITMNYSQLVLNNGGQQSGVVSCTTTGGQEVMILNALQ
jgi:hypothetical protein